MSERYFSATALGGRLYPDSAVAYCDEAVVDMLAAHAGHWKVRTEMELLSVMGESERGLPSIRVWIHEELQKLTRLTQST